MVSLNNAVLTNNAYSAANSLVQGGTKRVNVQVSIRSGVSGSGSIYLQLADPMNPSGTSYMNELFLLPGLYSFDRECSGARVRGATAAGAAVTLELLTDRDLGSA